LDAVQEDFLLIVAGTGERERSRSWLLLSVCSLSTTNAASEKKESVVNVDLVVLLREEDGRFALSRETPQSYNDESMEEDFDVEAVLPVEMERLL